MCELELQKLAMKSPALPALGPSEVRIGKDLVCDIGVKRDITPTVSGHSGLDTAGKTVPVQSSRQRGIGCIQYISTYLPIPLYWCDDGIGSGKVATSTVQSSRRSLSLFI